MIKSKCFKYAVQAQRYYTMPQGQHNCRYELYFFIADDKGKIIYLTANRQLQGNDLPGFFY